MGLRIDTLTKDSTSQRRSRAISDKQRALCHKGLGARRGLCIIDTLTKDDTSPGPRVISNSQGSVSQGVGTEGKAGLRVDTLTKDDTSPGPRAISNSPGSV